MVYDGIYKGELTPIVKYGENLYLIPLKKYFSVMYVEPLPGDLKDFGALSAGEVAAGYTQVTDMNMSEFELAQWRVKLLDDITLSIRQKQGVGKYITRNVMEQLEFRTAIYSGSGNMFEIYVYEDEAPWIQATNPTNYDIEKSRIFFEGFRYVLQELTDVPSKSTAVPVWDGDQDQVVR